MKIFALLNACLFASIAAYAAAPAGAAPTLGVNLTRDQAAVSHSDERVDYAVEVTNASAVAASAGDELFCIGVPPQKTWFGSPTAFAFEWRRNGATIPGAEAGTYTATAADAGKAIQCLVTGTNLTAAATYASSPAAVVAPSSPPPPPSPTDRTANNSRPWVTDETGGFESAEGASASVKRFCKPPANWQVEGSPFSGPWSYHWLRNGVRIAGAITDEYEPSEAEDKGKILQCEVIGTGAGGAVVGISDYNRVSLEASNNDPPFATATNGPEVAPNVASGPVTAELELPGGEETFVFNVEGNGWSCDKVPASGASHAMALCTRGGGVLPPAASYPPIKVKAALGADAPDEAIAKATVFGGGSVAPVSAVSTFIFDPFKEFGLVPGTFSAKLLDAAGHDYTQAGGHPFKGVGVFQLTTKRTLTAAFDGNESAPIEHVKQVITDLPRGQIGNALAVPELCGSVTELKSNHCPQDSAVGAMDIVVRGFGGGGGSGGGQPIFAIKPEFGTPAQFAFEDPGGTIYTLSTRLRADDGYAISLDLAPPPKVDFLKGTATICDFGAKLSGSLVVGCKEPNEPGANPKPLFTNPTRCGQPAPVLRARLRSWENPDIEKTFSFTGEEITGCDQVHFEPKVNLQPTTHRADSATGLDVNLTMPTNGLEGKDDEGNRDPNAISQANLKRAKITFPQGMTVNPTAGKGLGVCSAEQVKLETNLPIECPDSSKIGSVEIETPIIEETLKGDVYIAKQGDVGGALIGFYLVFDSKKDGILVKVPARVDPQENGQLVVTVDDSPEAPFSAVHMHFPGGPRATLLTPPKCGTYSIKAELSPWTAADPNNPTAAETVTEESTFKITEGPNGPGCPNGALDPKLSAGTENPVAGKTSPFVMRLSRDDGTQRFSGLSIHTPPGLTAYLKGIPYCPQSTINSISKAAGTGLAEIASPSCPAASRIGTVIAGAGAGADPLFVETGKAYLAGPYKGAPLSIVAVAPAVAGPLDLGTVTVQNAVFLDPETAQVNVVSDPIPTILHGLLLDIRDIRVKLDRSHFTLNPTNCEPLSIGVDVKGETGGSASVSNKFQVGGCNKLKFKPKLSVNLVGGTKRGANPEFHAVYTTGAGEANVSRAAFTIPRSEFLDQSHIRTICTRVQFAADACPKGSVYGHVTAYSPLVDYPVSGPMYLRSSSHKLPDLVFDLHGPDYQPIEAIVDGRIDSVKGQIRVTIEGAPDVPVSKLVVTQQGGAKGLLINSRDVCAGSNRATVKLTAQNGMTHNFRPIVKNGKCNQPRKAKRKHGRH
jgi:hypothetical protein